MIKAEGNRITIYMPKMKDELIAAKTIEEAGLIFKGDKGEKGDKGIQGNIGKPGINGVDGEDGKDGRDGKDGVGIVSITQPDEDTAVINYTDGTKDELKLPRGEDGREIELGYSQTHLQWRYVGQSEWKNLFPIPKSAGGISGGGAGSFVLRLANLQDVNFTNLQNGDIIQYNASTGKWENVAPTSGGGHIIEEEGTPLIQRAALNFVGAGVTVTDDAGNDATVVTIAGGGGGGVTSINGLTGAVILSSDGTIDFTIDTAGELVLSVADLSGLYIRTDGASVTTAPIPFAESIIVTGHVDGGGDSTAIDVICPLAATTFAMRIQGYYTDGIRFDGATDTTDSSISNFFAFQDNTLFEPTLNGKSYWSFATAPVIRGAADIDSVYGHLATPFSPPGGVYTGTTTEVIAFEAQALWGSGTVTSYKLFHGKINFISSASNLYGLHLEDITGGSIANFAIKTGLGLHSFGDDVVFGADDTNDIGKTGANRPKNIYVARQFISQVATGTAPIAVTSTTKVTNLNVDQVDGFDLNQNVLTSSSPTFVTVTLSQATGTAPLTVSSTTKVTNLNADQADGFDFDQAVLTTSSPIFKKLVLSETTGTPPMTVASTTAVTNLNADLLDGQHAAAFQPIDAALTSFAGVSWVQGDLLVATGVDTFIRIPKSTTATRYLANTGLSNEAAWAQINLANGVTGDLPFANLTQGAGLSVLGIAGNVTADFAAITAASDFQVLRRSGSAVAFGSVNLASSNAVTGLLPVANVTTGTSGANIPLLNAANTWSGIQTFLDTTMAIRNAANTFSVTLASAATANRVVTLPNATTTLVGSSQSVTWTTGTATWSSASDVTLNLVSTGGGADDYSINNIAGVFRLIDTTTSVVHFEVDNGDLVFAATNGTFFNDSAGNALIGFGSTTLFFSSSGVNSSSIGFGTANTMTFGVGSPDVTQMTLTSGNLTLKDAFNIVGGTSTGTKLMGAANQKLGIWNATPDVQPTTGITGAAFVGGGGTAVTTTDTFGGYTLAQLAAVIRRVGIAA